MTAGTKCEKCGYVAAEDGSSLRVFATVCGTINNDGSNGPMLCFPCYASWGGKKPEPLESIEPAATAPVPEVPGESDSAPAPIESIESLDDDDVDF